MAKAHFANLRAIEPREVGPPRRGRVEVALFHHFGKRIERVAMQHRRSKSNLVQRELGERLLARIFHRETDYQRGGDAAEGDAMADRIGRHQVLVEMALRRVHHQVGDQYVVDLADGLAARVLVNVAEVEVLEIIVAAGQALRP